MGVSKRLHTERTMGRGRTRGKGSSGSALQLETHFFFDRPAVKAALAPRVRRFLSKWGGYTRRVARGSIKRMGFARKAPKRKYRDSGKKTWTKAYRRWWLEVQRRPASVPGTPPHTHTGLLKESIFYALGSERKNVIVGVTPRKMGHIGMLHEHGGKRFGKRYPPRPFMAPAREEANKKQKQFWL